MREMEEIRGNPLEVGSLEEMVDDQHGIVNLGGAEYYAPLLSFVDKEQLELGCSVLCHNRQHAIVGVLQDDVNPLVYVMKVDKAPEESYADIGGHEDQIQEMKEAVEFPLTHPPQGKGQFNKYYL